MQIVTTHSNMDFDALASVVACTLLYPGATGVLPSHISPGVKAFLSIHQDLFMVQPRKGFDLEAVESLVVVDANNWRRLDRMEALAAREVDIICWDHHMEGVNIGGSEQHREEVGAAITLILEEMQRQDTPFTPMHATLFLLGIYDDTGCLCFSSATPRDAHMVGYLLENGADLNIVSAYLAHAVDEVHSEVFSGMLARAQIFEVDGLRIGLCSQQVKSGLTMLANLVTKYREFKGLDAAIGIFSTELDKYMVIGRSNPQGIDVGLVMRKLGGGGHAGAGSAVVKGIGDRDLVNRVIDLVNDAVQKEVLVGKIMSSPGPFMADMDMTMSQAQAVLERQRVNAVMVCEGHKFLGTLSRADFAKADKTGRMETSVKGYMKRKVPRASTSQNARQALDLMGLSADGVLPVVGDDDLLEGVLTRGDILLEIYDM